MLRTICSAFLIFSLCSVAFAQQESVKVTPPSATPLITAGSSAERVRFAAPSTVVQMHLQVYADSGQIVFDTMSKGNVLDWTVQDGSGERLRTGSYLCAVTAKSLNGKLSQRIGEVAVEEQRTELRAVDLTHMTAAQQREIGPVEEDATILVLDESESPSATVIAHNGEDGQIIRGRGALSFRIGDFFSGKDTEQMRLTPEGNLGIGITNPVAKLDVLGLIRTSQGIVFPDGSIQYSASRNTFGDASLPAGQSQKKRAQGEDFRTAAIDVSGTGTTGRIPKWLDGAGTLGDSNIFEVSSAIGVNGAPNTAFRLDVNGSTRIRGSNPGFNLEGLSAGGNIWLFQTVDDNGRFRLFGQDNINPGVERLTISLSSGNVGIGATVPAAKLDVAGDIRSSALRQELTGFSPNVIGGFIGTGSGGATPGNRVQAGAEGATIGGGGRNIGVDLANRVTDSFGTVGGGVRNRAGNDDATVTNAPNATVGGGDRNTASGQSATVGGGVLNIASAPNATVSGGALNTAVTQGSTVGGGLQNTASADFSVVPGGRGAIATHFGEMAFSSDNINSPGDAQTSVYTLQRVTTNTTSTELFLDQASTQRITIAAGRALSFEILVVAKTAVGLSAGYTIRGLIENVSGVTSFVGTPTVTVLGEDNAVWNVTVEADDANDALVVKVAGSVAATIRWLAAVRTAEVIF